MPTGGCHHALFRERLILCLAARCIYFHSDAPQLGHLAQ